MWKATDNRGREYTVSKVKETYVVNKSEICDAVEYIDFINEDFFVKEKTEGYYVIADFDKKGSRLCYFKKRKNVEKMYRQDLMPIFGIKKPDGCYLVIVQGCKFEFSLVFGVKDGNYYIYPRFYLNGDTPYENISLTVMNLDSGATYSDMAVAYRNFQLGSGACKTLKEKIAHRPELSYAVQSPEIRIRLGWKPAPPKVLEQTVQNEPEMKVACTFSRVCDLIDELKAQGVDKAQLCLVGWNKSGHDGRWPQMFPVEEKLGGVEGLENLISHAKQNGYQIVCHTNSTDCYSIADTFSEDIVIKKKDGSLSVSSSAWSGGRMYELCPVKALEYAKEYLPKVKELGFSGLHYIDVLSVVRPRCCYDKNHFVNSAQTAEIYNEIMKLCHELFGGFSSEGCFDFASQYLDYGLYVSWPEISSELADETVPLWQIVYHGIMLYNSTTDTVNYPVKDEKNRLRVVEDGSRPSFYFYSKFMEGSANDDWLGREDMVCNTDEELKYSVSKIKEAYEDYKTRVHLQTEFIVNHCKIRDNVFEVEYSDGTVLKIDYNNK